MTVTIRTPLLTRRIPRCFDWTINENVSNFAPVQLTYTVKLTKPETDPGTYGVEDLKGEKNAL